MLTAATLVAVAFAGCGADDPEPVEPVHLISDPWQPEPFAVDGSVVAALDGACAGTIQPHGLPLAVVDVRGGSRAMLLYAGLKDQADCLVEVRPDGTMTLAGGGASGSSDPMPQPADGNVQVWSYGSSGGAGSGQTSNVIGQVGPLVSRVVITTKAGRNIRATSGRTGWFVAWWPTGEEFLNATGFDVTGAQTGTAQ